jgi:hypothetical protein
MGISYQHRLVASLMVMSLVVLLLTLATRNIEVGSVEEELELTPIALAKPSPEAIALVKIPASEDLVPMEDPMNLAVVVAVGLASECLEGIRREYYLPMEVQLGEEGVIKTRLEALPEDVEGRTECLAASMHANGWPEVHGVPRWIKFSVPPTVTTQPPVPSED